MQRLKQLEDENRPLKHIVAEQTLEHPGFESGDGKKVVGPVAKRVAVGWLVDARVTSLRRACRVLELSTGTWRDQRRVASTNRELLARLQAHAAIRPRYGYRRLHTLVAREGLVADHKRVYRDHRTELSLPNSLS